ncbi:unnamed protein product [Adineta steineri]|uniref:DNA-directed primase/polymerase protein n=1 Tax=Adineta steineri TaxID=433720 RepID=A0A814SD81_9BILA|nr:unnamed protein product [Adineta steineri]
MNISWKNRLQEYCQKRKISLPTYRVKNQSGPGHMLEFQVEVKVNNQWYVGDESCVTKKEAEHSTAKNAWESLMGKSVYSVETSGSSQLSKTISTSEEHLDPVPSDSKIPEFKSMNHLPDEYAYIEQFIDAKVKENGGRIRKIVPLRTPGQYKFEIAGPYRFCENVQRHHRKNQIYFLVHPMEKTYFQKCHDPECYGFRSVLKNIADEQKKALIGSSKNHSTDRCSHCKILLTSKNRSECERCDEMFCEKCTRECELCCDAIHCERCFESCFDCHDS